VATASAFFYYYYYSFYNIQQNFKKQGSMQQTSTMHKHNPTDVLLAPEPQGFGNVDAPLQ